MTPDFRIAGQELRKLQLLYRFRTEFSKERRIRGLRQKTELKTGKDYRVSFFFNDARLNTGKKYQGFFPFWRSA
jgi:hypothetical protein